jgi:hypothetical protein
MPLLFRIFFCIFSLGFFLYLFVEKQNDVTRLQMEIPPLERAVRRLREENNRLRYEVERFESPMSLIELARKPEFGGLRHPYEHEIIVLPKGEPIDAG